MSAVSFILWLALVGWCLVNTYWSVSAWRKAKQADRLALHAEHRTWPRTHNQEPR